MARGRVFDGGKARKLREDRNMTPAELLDEINQIGPDEWALNTIHGGEKGRPVGLKLQHAWAEALNVSRSALLMDAPEQDDTTP
jgi:transcriptional regulator with XRE-family HTH domain